MAAPFAIGIAPPVWLAVLVGVGGVIYGVRPRPEATAGDLMLRRGPAVIGPGLLGFRGAADLDRPGRGDAGASWVCQHDLDHGGRRRSPVVVWSISKLLSIETGFGRGDADQVARDERIALDRDHRLESLAPGSAGSVLLARDNTELELQLSDGRIFRLPHEGFDRGEAKLLQA